MAKFPYDVIHLYYPRRKTKQQQAVYTFIKSLGRHQTEIMTEIMTEFLGEDNLVDYTTVSKKEIVRILKERLSNSGFAEMKPVKESGISKRDMESIRAARESNHEIIQEGSSQDKETAKDDVYKEKQSNSSIIKKEDPVEILNAKSLKPTPANNTEANNEKIPEIPEEIELFEDDDDDDFNTEVSQFVASMFDDGQG